MCKDVVSEQVRSLSRSSLISKKVGSGLNKQLCLIHYFCKGLQRHRCMLKQLRFY